MFRYLALALLPLLCLGYAIAADKNPTEIPTRQADQVARAFATNQADVDENYLDKKIQVTGTITRVTRETSKEKNATGPNYVVEFHTGMAAPIAYAPHTAMVQSYPVQSYSNGAVVAFSPQPPGALRFRFDAKHRKQLAELATGKMVTLEGVCKGEEKENIRFDDARIIKVHENAEPGSPYGVPGSPGPAGVAPSLTPPSSGLPFAPGEDGALPPPTPPTTLPMIAVPLPAPRG